VTKPGFFNVELERDELGRRIGGLPKGALMLVEGPDTYGKSIIAQRLVFSLLENNIPCTYISTELSTREFIKQMASVGYDIKDYILNGKLVYIPMFPIYGNVELQKGFIDRLMDAKELYESSVVVFDTFSYLLLKEVDSEERFFDIMDFFKRLANMEKTIIFTVDPNHLNQKFLNMVRSGCDIYFEIKMKTLGGERRRYINVNRFRRSEAPVRQVIPFRAEEGEGFIIDIMSLV